MSDKTPGNLSYCRPCSLKWSHMSYDGITCHVTLRKRASKFRALLRKMTYKDKGSNESSPPCTGIHKVESHVMSQGISCDITRDMGWLLLVGPLNLQVSFAEYRLFCRALLQKRAVILRSLLIVATPCHKRRSVTWLCI